MTPADVRKRLVEALEADLVGPFVPDTHPQGGQEILPLAPSRWYLTGFLAPQGARAPDAEDQSVLLAGYSFDHAQEVLAPLHGSMRERRVGASFFVNIPQIERHAAREAHLSRCFKSFLVENWPFGDPCPRLYYDKRASTVNVWRSNRPQSAPGELTSRSTGSGNETAPVAERARPR